MVLVKEEWLMPIGCICLAAAILADRFLLVEAPVLDFIIGILTGVSVVLNLVGLYKTGRKSKS
ncbi:MAG: hypothetical protein C4K48_00425 [Candidatus Thorarchaeota archaeon]|nr:MAG: hypothetical protein C4K48_00425 [Candidatus Thorarchaeota archaeon]